MAAGIARALDDDEALYRAWARAARLGIHDLALLNELEAISRTPAYVSLVESGEELPRLEAPVGRADASVPEGDLAMRLREVASHLGPEALAARRPRRPVGPGRRRRSAAPRGGLRHRPRHRGRPGRARGVPPVVDRLLLDRRLLEGHDAQQLFAYEVTPAATTHLRGVAAPGDRIVFQRHGAVTPDRICAIRTGKGIVLARALVKEGALLLLPGEGEVDFESVELSGHREAVRRRRWEPTSCSSGGDHEPRTRPCRFAVAGLRRGHQAQPAFGPVSARPGRGRVRDGVAAGDLRRPDPAGRLGRVVPRHERLLHPARSRRLVVRAASTSARSSWGSS